MISRLFGFNSIHKYFTFLEVYILPVINYGLKCYHPWHDLLDHQILKLHIAEELFQLLAVEHPLENILDELELVAFVIPAHEGLAFAVLAVEVEHAALESFVFVEVELDAPRAVAV